MISQKHFWWCKYKWYGLLSILISSPNICIFNWRQCFAMGYLYHMQPNKSGFIAILHKHSLLLLVSHYYKIIPCGRMSVRMTYQFSEFTVLGGSIRRQNRVMQYWPDRLDMSPSHLFHYSLLLLLPATFPSRHTFEVIVYLWLKEGLGPYQLYIDGFAYSCDARDAQITRITCMIYVSV